MTPAKIGAMIILSALAISLIVGIILLIKFICKKKAKKKEDNSIEETENRFYRNIDEPLCIIYHFKIIGSYLKKLGGYSGYLTLVDINRDDTENFCTIHLKQGVSDYIINLAKDSSILDIEEDKTTDNVIEFNIKFVLAKASQLTDIVDNEKYRNSIIILGDRDRASMTVFINEDGKLKNRTDIYRMNTIEYNTLGLYHILTTQKNEDSLRYGQIYPYTYVGDLRPDLIQDRVGVVFRIITRYNPNYIGGIYCYDY